MAHLQHQALPSPTTTTKTTATPTSVDNPFDHRGASSSTTSSSPPEGGSYEVACSPRSVTAKMEGGTLTKAGNGIENQQAAKPQLPPPPQQQMPVTPVTPRNNIRQINPFDDDESNNLPATAGSAVFDDLLSSPIAGGDASGPASAPTTVHPLLSGAHPQQGPQQTHPLLQGSASRPAQHNMPPRPPMRKGSGGNSSRHRSARTLCTSELHSAASMAASGLLGTDLLSGYGPPPPQQVGGGGGAGTPPSPRSRLGSASSVAGVYGSTQQQQHPLPPSSPSPETTKQLSELAAALSSAKPRALNDTERAEESAALARVTLGEQPKESTGTRKTHHQHGGGGKKGHRRTGSVEQFKNIVSPHRKARSLGMADWMGIVDKVNEAGGGSRDNRDYNKRHGGLGGILPGGGGGSKPGSRAGSVPSSPGLGVSPKRTVAAMMVGGRSSRSGSRRNSPAATATAAGEGDVAAAVMPSLPDLEKLGSDLLETSAHSTAAAPMDGGPSAEPQNDPFAENGDSTLAPSPASPTAAATEGVPSLRSSEQDPAPHQVDIPPVDEFLRAVRMCSVLDNYRLVDQNFDFGRLAGISRIGLEGFVSGNTTTTTTSAAADGSSSDTAALLPAHRPIASSILECGDDVVVDGFFHEIGSVDSARKTEDDTGTGRDKATDDRVEVAVLSSQRHRQFVVVWRGPTDDQAKPVRNRHLKHAKEVMAKDVHEADLAEDQPVPVFPAYRDSYLKDGLEDGVFALLDDLADRTPFCDVVMTGHSFGAALATLAAVRYAASRPMMRVCCHAFGCPRVGGVEFRHWTNSLPNLKVMRIEYGSDPWVHAPEGATWSHVGHSVVVSSSVAAPPKPGGASLRGENASERSTGDERGGGVGSVGGSNGGPPALVVNTHSKPEQQPVRAYRFDHHRPSHAGGFLTHYVTKSRLGHHHGSKSERNDHALDAYVTAMERIAHLGLPWVVDYIGEDAGEGVVSGVDHEKRLVV